MNRLSFILENNVIIKVVYFMLSITETHTPDNGCLLRTLTPKISEPVIMLSFHQEVLTLQTILPQWNEWFHKRFRKWWFQNFTSHGGSMLEKLCYVCSDFIFLIFLFIILFYQISDFFDNYSLFLDLCNWETFWYSFSYISESCYVT